MCWASGQQLDPGAEKSGRSLRDPTGAAGRARGGHPGLSRGCSADKRPSCWRGGWLLRGQAAGEVCVGAAAFCVPSGSRRAEPCPGMEKTPGGVGHSLPGSQDLPWLDMFVNCRVCTSSYSQDWKSGGIVCISFYCVRRGRRLKVQTASAVSFSVSFRAGSPGSVVLEVMVLGNLAHLVSGVTSVCDVLDVIGSECLMSPTGRPPFQESCLPVC